MKKYFKFLVTKSGFVLLGFIVGSVWLAYAAQTTVNTSSDTFQTAWDRQEDMNAEQYGIHYLTSQAEGAISTEVVVGANGLTLIADGSTFENMRTDLGLVIGTDVEAYDAAIVKSDEAETLSSAWDLGTPSALILTNATIAGDFDFGAHEIRAETFESDITTGTAPFTVASSTVVANLTAETAGVSTTVTGTANNSANETVYPVFFDGQTGAQEAESDVGLTYNPSTGTLTTTLLAGALNGTVGATTPAAGAFTTLSATGSITAGPSSTPNINLNDDDGTGSDDADKYAGSIEANMTTTTEDSEVSDLSVYYQDAGSKTAAFIIDGSDNQVEFGINTTLQAGDIVTAEIGSNQITNALMADNAIDTAELATGAVEADELNANAVTYAATSGSFKSLTPVTDDADDFAAEFTGANLYGGTFVANLAGDVDLPAPVAGMNFTIITMGDIEVDILPTAGDDILLDGEQLDDNHDVSNTGSAGDIAVVQYYDADGWLITSNGWTEVAD